MPLRPTSRVLRPTCILQLVLPLNQMQADIVVVGAGTAGIPCAIEAAGRGRRVVVVEKDDRIGGTLWLTGGHLSGAGSRRQRAKGIEDSPQAHLADVERISRGTADRRLAELAVHEAAGTLDWLDDLGVEFEPDTPRVIWGHEAYAAPRTTWAVGTGVEMLEAMRPLWDAGVEAGRIVPLLGHALAEILVGDGRAVGVAARGPQGRVEVRAGHVVIATGGYASNADFFADVTPGRPRLVSTAHAHAQGDGIRAAMGAGGAFRGGEHYLPSWGGIELEPGSGRASYHDAWATIFTSVYRAPREVVVNAKGERFIREDEPSSDARERALMRQPDHRLWLVFDEAALEDGPPLVKQWAHADLREHLGAGAIGWQAETVEALADAAGLPPGALAETVARYNGFVASGEDADFGRQPPDYPVSTPPFYAVAAHATSLISFGGLHVDADLRVLDADGEPIPGLYAIGEALGAGATSGNAFCSGMLLTPALSFGRILGRRLGGENS